MRRTPDRLMRGRMASQRSSEMRRTRTRRARRRKSTRVVPMTRPRRMMRTRMSRGPGRVQWSLEHSEGS